MSMVISHDFCNDNFRIFLRLQTDHDRKVNCSLFIFGDYMWFEMIHLLTSKKNKQTWKRDRRGRDRMMIRFTPIYAISTYHHQRRELESRSCGVYLIQHYVIMFVSDLRQIISFLQVLWFPPAIRFIAMI